MADQKPKGLFKRAVERVIRFETTVLLTVFYFTVFGLTAIVARLFGKEFLSKRSAERKSYWHPHSQDRPDLDSMRRQF